jgi:hypothetical protein
MKEPEPQLMSITKEPDEPQLMSIAMQEPESQLVSSMQEPEPQFMSIMQESAPQDFDPIIAQSGLAQAQCPLMPGMIVLLR